MIPKLHVDPASPTPIWKQIVDQLRRLVASGALARDLPLPSVREMALELRINPATVARAYQELVEAGVLEVRRGTGTFVAEATPDRSLRREELMEAARLFVRASHELEASLEEAREAVTITWNDTQKGSAR